MSARDELVMSLSKELMGPRKGRTEAIKGDPRHEYMAGILEPKDYQRKKSDDLVKKTNSDIREASDKKSSEISGGHATEDEDEETVENNLLLTDIDPRAFPKSLGMTFILDNTSEEIGVCVTWARYRRDGEFWKRSPDYMVLDPCKVNCSESGNIHCKSEKDHVRAEVRVSKINGSAKFISVAVINTTPQQASEKLMTEALVFQPQIRVILKNGSSLMPLPDNNILDYEESVDDELVKEEQNMAMLYKDRTAYGRGLQCGVIWKDIDPEHDSDEYEKYENPPYGWTDAATVDQQHRNNYINSDIRTEFFPVYSITNAEDNDSLDGMFKASELSTKFSPEFYANGNLSKIVAEYTDWIMEQNMNIPSDESKETAKTNLDKCSEINERIKGGIELLAKNEPARLAFCFMNKAMDMQASWARNEPLTWRPFQIAFILMALESVVNRSSKHRDYFDLLWYPTGGGKTEAYLGLAIFTMAFRRLEGGDFDGVSVISRYTLRLLTIQQYRRALRAVTAAEMLRTKNWHPTGSTASSLWGLSRFSIGLWVGNSVTPNSMTGYDYWNQSVQARAKGALDILCDPFDKGKTSDPAQVLNCPLCNSILALPPEEMSIPQDLFLVVRSKQRPSSWREDFKQGSAELVQITQMENKGYYSVRIRITPKKRLPRKVIGVMLKNFTEKQNANPACIHPIFPGYFLKKDGSVYRKELDFEIRCPNMDCETNNLKWEDFVPTEDGYGKNEVIEPFRTDDPTVSKGMPITAYTVDDQIYHKCPSMVIATVDKIARLAFEPRGASLFGNVDKFDRYYGYYREGKGNEPTIKFESDDSFQIKPFMPPDLIIQDELHLVEGPLGTMVGIYEMAVDALSSSGTNKVKYVGSTATIRAAWSQITSTYGRKLAQFPPNGITASDNFFARSKERHPRDSEEKGRLYMGICTPGTSVPSALKIIWSTLLQTPLNIVGKYEPNELDRFMTVVGYFNAIRELSTAVGIYRQDVHEWIKTHFKPNGRDIGVPIELSSRIDSMDLPSILDRLESGGDKAIPGVFATSMFGTGVDINRLGLMVVHGQPKTTANYIQATGRVGRTGGGLVISYFRHTKPRDLDHYEFFTRYHRSIHRYVEPVTVTPFSMRCLERTVGPVATLLLRNSRKINGAKVDPRWSEEYRIGKHKMPPGSSGSRMMKDKNKYGEIKEIVKTFVERSHQQPPNRLPDSNKCKNLVSSEISKWASRARNYDHLLYWESAYSHSVVHDVVLGGDRHDEKNKSVYEKAPQSLRNVESTTRFVG